MGDTETAAVGGAVGAVGEKAAARSSTVAADRGQSAAAAAAVGCGSGAAAGVGVAAPVAAAAESKRVEQQTEQWNRSQAVGQWSSWSHS